MISKQEAEIRFQFGSSDFYTNYSRINETSLPKGVELREGGFDKIYEYLEAIYTAIDELIKVTDDGLGLQLKQGRFIAVEGIYEAGVRNLHVEFSYNKTFEGNRAYPQGGSWTGNMRPDYTLTIWPYGITKEQADYGLEQENQVHITFCYTG